LHETGLECSEQFSKLCEHQIPDRYYVKNLGTDSVVESSMNFKGLETFWGKSEKFSKIPS
jgi:hypothetical protein